MRQYGTSAMIIQFQLLFASRPACCYRFEACSAFTHVSACTLALSPIRDTLTRGFSHFVTSMTAPVASGWSGCRVGLAPTGKRRLSTAHTRSGRQGRLAEHLTRMDFIVLDELGYLPFAQSGGQLLFHLVSRLYERTS